MANSKLRCTVCREYFDRNLFYGAGCCSEECFNELVGRARRKRARRAENRSKKVAAKKVRNSMNQDLKRKVRERDGQRCRSCGTPNKLHVHHIEYLSQGGANSKINLITLCEIHHALVHSNKHKYQPLCRGYIWLLYVEGIKADLGEVERWTRDGTIPIAGRRLA